MPGSQSDDLCPVSPIRTGQVEIPWQTLVILDAKHQHRTLFTANPRNWGHFKPEGIWGKTSFFGLPASNSVFGFVLFDRQILGLYKSLREALNVRHSYRKVTSILHQN